MTQRGGGETIVQPKSCREFEGDPQRGSGVFAVASPPEEAAPAAVCVRERFASLSLDDVPAPILGLNQFEQVITTNAEARKLLGLGADEWRGQPIQVLLNFACSIREEFHGDSPDIHTHHLTLRGGHDLPQSVTLTIRRVGGDTSVHYLCMLSSGASPVAAGPGSSDLLAAMGQMIAGFAHEVRNPLAALKSIIEDLSTEPEVRATWPTDFARLNALVGRIERLTRGSLRMVQSERPNRKAVAVRVLVSSALDLLAARIPASAEGAIKLTFDVEIPKVFVDENQIVQTLVIVLENALDAAGSAEHVRIRVREEQAPRGDAEGGVEAAQDRGRVAVIDIEDDGPGISPEIISKIFTPFFTRKPRGTGLGLSIAVKLLWDNQGSVCVHSVVGKGSVFSIRLPVIF